MYVYIHIQEDLYTCFFMQFSHQAHAVLQIQVRSFRLGEFVPSVASDSWAGLKGPDPDVVFEFCSSSGFSYEQLRCFLFTTGV